MRTHIEHLLAASAAVAFALFVSYFNTGPVPRVTPSALETGTLRPIASDTRPFATTTTPTLSTTTLEFLFPTPPATTSQSRPKATSTAAKPAVPVAVKPKPKPVATPPITPVVAPPVAVTPPPAKPAATTTISAPEPEVAASGLKDAIVNIICVAHDGTLRSISGSGVIIDSRGIILTVAHVAQSSLLQEYLGSDKVACTVRTGSPAKSAYTARPIYVSDAWIKANSTTLISSHPTGTGEHDYALLAITGSATGKPLPSSFPAVTLTTGQAHIGDAVAIGSYGAQDLTGTQIRSALYPTLVASTVKDRYTFTSNTVDVLAIAGSAASQEGSSGGAVVNDNGSLLGIITTSETTGEVSSREMRIITMGYIRRNFEEETGKSFDSFFGNTSLTTLLNLYAPTAQTLGQFLAKAIGFDL